MVSGIVLHQGQKGSGDRHRRCKCAVSVVWPRRMRVMATSNTRECCRIQGCGEESIWYWLIEVVRRASPSVLFQVEWQTWVMRRLTVKTWRGSGEMFTEERAILAEVSATSLP
ncbi:hypothetical protein E2C01_073665 [Portunus trituberculatus]|uniref:Uncharacterized protein n=1 Tax=Portunus trituberculatus TaxID=210409 RepID=A0A5B7IA17_PORTR|nr:hypothetical protein [Portunus trituberculatus]